jgi:hypothetical protein
MEDFARALADFVRDHQVWAAPIVLLLAFGESLAFPPGGRWWRSAR